MLEAITPDFLPSVKNPVFRVTAGEYIDIAEDYARQIVGFGMPFSDAEYLTVFGEKVAALEARGLHVDNDHRSLSVGWVSPSCVICRRGVATATFLVSNQCTRNCFFCFNPNQENYEELRADKDDPVAKLARACEQGVPYRDLALTGGEPLLHKAETEAFFRQAKALYPDAYTRLYTSGSFLDEDYLRVLRDTGLDEIRFSVKTDDSPAEQALTLERIRLSKAYIPSVMVEMPVMPDELELMQGLLVELDGIGIAGINLLELCFPFNNAAEFVRRGYAIKSPPFRVLYNYTYAGGLPIAGSEDACLRLLEFALERGLKMGVHYCSLENKFSGQVYLQNHPHRAAYPFSTFSERDYFLKSAKVFGHDVPLVERTLQKMGLKRVYKDADVPSLEFPITYLERLRSTLPDLEVGISYHIVEQDEGSTALRELRIDYTTPARFEQGDV